jgi:hypothetical protein
MERGGLGQIGGIISEFDWRDRGDYEKPQRRQPISGKRFEPIASNVLHVLQNDPPRFTRKEGPCVKCAECTLCSMTVLVRCFLPQPLVHCCRTLPKNKNESENPSPRSVLTFRLSHLMAVRQGVCCSCLTSSCKYALFSFLERRGKDQTGKTLTS